MAEHRVTGLLDVLAQQKRLGVELYLVPGDGTVGERWVAQSYDVHDELAATPAASGGSPREACDRLARMLDGEA